MRPVWSERIRPSSVSERLFGQSLAEKKTSSAFLAKTSASSTFESEVLVGGANGSSYVSRSLDANCGIGLAQTWQRYGRLCRGATNRYCRSANDRNSGRRSVVR